MERVIHLNRYKRYCIEFELTVNDRSRFDTENPELTADETHPLDEGETNGSDSESNGIREPTHTDEDLFPEGAMDSLRRSDRIKRKPRWLEDEQWPDDFSP